MIGKILFLAVSGMLLAACQPKAAADLEESKASKQAEATGPGKAPPPPEAVQPEPMAGPAVQHRNTEVVDARIVEVTLSDHGNPESGFIGATKTRFRPSDTVYVLVETDGSANGYTLYAKWLDDKRNVLSEYGLTVSQPGRQRQVLSLSKPDGWNPGRHAVELVINDGKRRSVNFDVVSP